MWLVLLFWIWLQSLLSSTEEVSKIHSYSTMLTFKFTFPMTFHLCLGPLHICATLMKNWRSLAVQLHELPVIFPTLLSPWTSYLAKFLVLYPEDKFKGLSNPKNLNNESIVLNTSWAFIAHIFILNLYFNFVPLGGHTKQSFTLWNENIDYFIIQINVTVPNLTWSSYS